MLVLKIKLNDDNICYIIYKNNCSEFYIEYIIKSKHTGDVLEKDNIDVTQWDKITLRGEDEDYAKMSEEVTNGSRKIEKILYDVNDLLDIMPQTINELVDMINFYTD